MATLEKMILSLESYLALQARRQHRCLRPAAASGPAQAGSSTTSGEATTASAADGATRRRRDQDRIDGRSAGHRAGRGCAPGFREDIMSAHSGRLQHALKHFREQWDITQESWDDPVSRDFERIHLVPLEQLTKGAITGMEKLSESLGKIRAQCKED